MHARVLHNNLEMGLQVQQYPPWKPCSRAPKRVKHANTTWDGHQFLRGGREGELGTTSLPVCVCVCVTPKSFKSCSNCEVQLLRPAAAAAAVVCVCVRVQVSV